MLSTIDLISFGQNLKSIRQSLFLTRKDVATLSHLSKDTIYKVENGDVIPRYETLEILSHVYRQDLLELLMRHRQSHDLFTFNQELEYMIYSHDINALMNLSIRFSEIEANLENTIIYNHKVMLQQYRLFIKSIEYYYSKDVDKCINAIEAGIKLTNTNFELKNWSSFKFSVLESRMLLLASLALSESKEYIFSNQICIYLIDSFCETEKLSSNDKFLLAKCYYNLAYNYHNLNDIDNVINYANLGIKHCNKYYINYALPHLLYRKGIALYMQNNDLHMDILKSSIILLNTCGADQLADQFISITQEKYNIDISISSFSDTFSSNS